MELVSRAKQTTNIRPGLQSASCRARRGNIIFNMERNFLRQEKRKNSTRRELINSRAIPSHRANNSFH